jgi:hypothetical protein
MNKEVWKKIPIEGAEDYQVSSKGRVLSLKKGGARILRNAKCDGYTNTNLYFNKRPHTHGVARLVLLVFVGPCPPGSEASHINGIRSDNRINNLVWETHSENIRRAVKQGHFRDPDYAK